MKKYPGLSAVASLLKILGIVVLAVGVIVGIIDITSARSLFGIPLESTTIIPGIIIILISLIFGLLVYASGELFICIVDIEANTRKNQTGVISPSKQDIITEKKRQIEKLQSEIDKEFKNG